MAGPHFCPALAWRRGLPLGTGTRGRAPASAGRSLGAFPFARSRALFGAQGAKRKRAPCFGTEKRLRYRKRNPCEATERRTTGPSGRSPSLDVLAELGHIGFFGLGVPPACRPFGGRPRRPWRQAPHRRAQDRHPAIAAPVTWAYPLRSPRRAPHRRNAQAAQRAARQRATLPVAGALGAVSGAPRGPDALRGPRRVVL